MGSVDAVAPAGVGFHRLSLSLSLSLFPRRDCLWRGKWKKSTEARKWHEDQSNVSFRYRNPMQHKQTSAMGHVNCSLSFVWGSFWINSLMVVLSCK
ncbi:hypothetical protein MUK42_25679 [Musa troglodytarum]|uniref:Uncharacterized protein n=1 Tax=Musa troglodytarum TaxID=320322 RepID=A0A9E7GCY7_9LILI|nr:hypothetical protein MUK42_25679 [Musa troglodytarum]